MKLLIVAALACFAQPPPAPRYALRAGERIEYRRTVSLEIENAATFEEIIQLIVLEAGPTGAHVLAIRVRDETPASAVHFRVSDRGQIVVPEETLARPETAYDLYELFPMLAPALDDQTVWLGEPDLFECRLRQRRVAVDGPSVQVRFTMEDATGVSDFLGDSTEGVYWFDGDAGLMTRREMTRYSGAERRKRTIRCQLIGRETLDDAWIDRRRAEWARFVRTQQIEDGLLDELGTHPERVNGTIRRLEHVWEEFLAQPPRDQASPLRRVADACQRRSKALSPVLRERAALAAQWIGAPAAEWSLQDAAGETVISETVRKGVSVECFWSVSATPSLRMFAVLERLRTERLPTPPSIICLNVDSDLAAARRAADKCGRGLLTVFSGPPIDGELPASMPIVRILDESGRVRRVHVGWRASLSDSIRAVAGKAPRSNKP